MRGTKILIIVALSFKKKNVDHAMLRSAVVADLLQTTP